MSTNTRADVARRSRELPSVSSGQAIVVADPRSGELLGPLHEEETDRLAEVELALHDAERALKKMRIEVDAELRHRFNTALHERGVEHPSGRHVVCAGDFEIRVEGGNESVWDAVELESTLRELLDDGALTARDLVTDLIKHPDPVVNRMEANRLLDRLGGPAHAAVARCRTWRRKGPGTVRVDRTAALPAPEN